jgi:hypothetical protein
MKIAFGALLGLLIFANQASAEAISLVCGGSMRRYLPTHQDINVAPEASSLDISNRQIITPIGTYPITQVEETKITFGTRALKGTLDRLTGAMLIFQRPDGDKTDMQTNMPPQVQMYADLKCSVAKRMF